MKPSRMLHPILTVLILASMLLSYAAPALYTARAQEATEEAPIEATDEPVAQPPAVEVTDEPVITPEATPEITEIPVEATPEVTVESPVEPTTEATADVTPTSEPTATPIPADTLFTEDFQDGEADGWLLSPGWYMTGEGDNFYLSALTPNETAAIEGISWTHLLLSVRFRVAAGNSAQIAFRSGAESYIITLDSAGQAALYRSGTLLAQGAVTMTETAPSETLWRTLNLHALGGQITVGVDGVVQFTYTDPAPLADGLVIISTGAANTGEVAFDDVVMNRLDAPVIIPEVTPETTVEPEITPEATAEPEITPEATVEPEITPEVTEEPNLPVLTADFEGEEVTGWTWREGASVVQESETNRALLMAGGASLTPAEPLHLGDFRIDARVNLIAGSGLSLDFRAQDGRSYRLSFEPTQTALYRVEGEENALLNSVPAEHAVNTWHTISLTASGADITVTVNDAAELTYTDEIPLISGQIAFTANADTNLMLDDIAVTDLNPIDVEPTAVPLVLTEAGAYKLDGVLVEVINLYLSDDEAGALALAAEYGLELDENNRLSVVIWASGEDAAAVAPLVETTGGVIASNAGRRLDASVTLASLAALVNTADVAAIEVPSRAVSTSSAGAPAGAPLSIGTVQLHSIDIIGANDWHVAGVRGAGVNVAIVDTGFNAGGTGAAGADRACFSGVAFGGTGNVGQSHGINVAEVICDIAPDANVRGYRATNAASMADAINAARGSNRVIVIAMDLGANVSPGDGRSDTPQNPDANAVYAAIKAARDAGVLVIAAAGNNSGRYVTINYSGGSAGIPVEVFSGDRINVSWSDWDGNPTDLNVSVSGISGGGDSSVGGVPSESFDVTGCANGCNATVNISGGGNFTVQIQIAGQGTLNGAVTGATVVNGAGNLARPADSPDALAVAAVCSSQDFGYPVLPDSSRGPIFTQGGESPLPSNTARDTIKPDLAAPSHVLTSLIDANDVTSCVPGFETRPFYAFGGTSAAAAHVAGMAALLISSPNTSMDAFNSGAGAANALKDYLQTHAADLYLDPDNPAADKPNGFDYRYGAGLTILGNPNYDLRTVTDFSTLSLPNIPGVLYVSHATPGTAQTGAHNAPFVHIDAAIAAAAPGEKVIVLPGEYVTPVYATGAENVEVLAYNSEEAFAVGNDSEFWVNSGYGRTDFDGFTYASFVSAGVFVEDSTDVVLKGFVFKQANPLEVSAGILGGFTRRTGLEYRTSTGGGVVDASFTGFRESIPVIVSDSASVSVLNSLFDDNQAETQRAATVLIQGSESNLSQTPILVQGNTFSNNTTRLVSFDETLVATIYIEESAADIYSNVFSTNVTEAQIRVENNNPDCLLETPPCDPAPPEATDFDNKVVNIISNLFINNGGGGAGPMVSADPAPRLRFINNTVAANRFDETSYADYSGVVTRGNDETGGARNVFGSQWDIHNNIFYNNNEYATPVEDVQTGGCSSIQGGSDNGARNNWIYLTGSVETGDCTGSLTNPAHNNLTTPDPLTEAFAGPELSLLPSNPLYYQVKQDADEAIDSGEMAALSPVVLPLANQVVDDAKGNPRVSDGNGDTVEIVEIGAFELTPLTALPLDTERREDIHDGIAPFYSINLANAVEGGFPPLTFSIKSLPANYSTDTGDTCGGAGLKIVGSIAFYCPPRHFYTHQGEPNTPGATQIVEPVTFEFSVTDITGVPPESNTITLFIYDEPDETLAGMTPLSYRFLARIDETFGLRLRPFVRFNNFRLSERGTLNENRAQYPYSYGSITVLDDTGSEKYNPFLFSDETDPNLARLESQVYIANAVANADPDDGLFLLDPQPNQLGVLRFTYTVTDEDGGTVTNTVRLEVVGTIPDRGLHDDTSFNFDYGNTDPVFSGNWTALYNEVSINNTLHQTRTLNDSARFNFIGEGFTLYMLGSGSGGLWELKIDDNTTPIQWALTNGEWFGTLTGESYTCRTRATVTTNLISNRGNAPYTVSCRGLRDGEAHSVAIINRQANRVLQVDAFSILFESDPLLPGYHDMNEPDVLPSFPGWTPIVDRAASKRIALSVSSTSVSEAHFRFMGTGFAVGTVLEGWGTGAAFAGAEYEICVTPNGGEEVCQAFDNSVGATTRPVWGVFRPFYGYDPDLVHEAVIRVTDIPAGRRFVVDSITVFNQQIDAPLDFGTTENDRFSAFVFANGADDSWVFDARSSKASNNTLHNMNPRMGKVGPFVSFQIPNEADMFAWYRLPAANDSQNVLVCVDRAQGEAGIANLCRQVNLRAAGVGNPVIVKESEFGNWGLANADNTHTVEIFSLVNRGFSVDKIQVFDLNSPLTPGVYEDAVFNQAEATAFKFEGGTFTRQVHTRASNGVFYQTTALNAGVLAQINGTGVAVGFTLDTAAGSVEICWAPGLLANAAAVDGDANKKCRTYNNNSASTLYQAARVVAGLSDTPENFTVVIRNRTSGKTMKFDWLEVFGALPGTVLVPGSQDSFAYETSFVNRVADDLFGYFGTGWRSVSGTPAKAYSGSNYDQVSSRIGAGIVFRLDNSNRFQIVRPASTRGTTLEVCIDPAVVAAPACQTVNNTTDPVVIDLPDTNEHIVSIATLSNRAFTLDAIRPLGSTLPLFPGVYEDNFVALNYSGTWTNLNARNYSAGRGRQTLAQDAAVTFNVNGSHVDVAGFVTQASQMEVCWANGYNAVSFTNCASVGTAPFSARQIHSVPLPGLGQYTVRVRNLAPVKLVFDYVTVFNGVDPLTAGRYEENHPKLVAGRTDPADWSSVSGPVYSGGAAARTTVINGALVFDFSGTGFDVRIPTGRFGSEVEVCYEAGALATFTAPDYADIDQFCYTYQHETAATVNTTARSVNGLADGTYSVRVELLDENGSLFGTRSAANQPKLIVDYVTIFDNDQPLVPVGAFEDNTVDGSGSRFLQLAPADRWKTITGRAASQFSGGSYAAVIDTTGRVSSKEAGPVASLTVEIPANSSVTVVLNTGTPSPRNAEKVLACFDNVTTASCQEFTTLRTQGQLAYSLSNNTGAPVERVVTFRALTPGEFKIDSFQIIEGTTLTVGLYDDTFASTTPGSLIELSGTWQSNFRSARAFGGSMARTRSGTASFTFDFYGTGFALITQQFTGGVDFQITLDGVPLCDAQKASNLFKCTTDLARGSNFQTGLATYGLPLDEYTVVVSINDTSISTLSDWFYLDAIAVFGDVSDSLEAGFYDNTELPANSVEFGPLVNWRTTAAASGPARGPYNRTDVGATNAGSAVQMSVHGNAMILYQGIASRNSNNVRICLVIEGISANQLECSNFSQSGRTTWFAPIAFYGFGSGEHVIIFENRAHGRRFNIDAVRVLP